MSPSVLVSPMSSRVMFRTLSVRTQTVNHRTDSSDGPGAGVGGGVFTARMSTPETSVLSLTQPVEDQDRALRFYCDVLGFEVRRDVAMGGGARWIEVAPPGSAVTVALVAIGGGVPQGIRLGVHHIDPLHETLQRDEVDVDDAVIRGPYAPAMFSVRDPDGNAIVLVELPGD
jgi:catechol 2,3-dioxygenase-like lactoylglutathione lyase family enzyme